MSNPKIYVACDETDPRVLLSADWYSDSGELFNNLKGAI